jgi:hypothetical protein
MKLNNFAVFKNTLKFQFSLFIILFNRTLFYSINKGTFKTNLTIVKKFDIISMFFAV